MKNHKEFKPHKDIKIDYTPQLRKGNAYLKSDPLWGVYCPFENKITYNAGNVTLDKGTKVKIKEYDSLQYYICEVEDDKTLKVLEIESFKNVVYGFIST